MITKILAKRPKPVMQACVSRNQAALLNCRNLEENVMLASELIKRYNSASFPLSCMLKVDIRKAFDTIFWDFILNCSTLRILSYIHHLDNRVY